jgi:hypothetical protein
MDAQEVDLLTICKGATREIFARELARIAANIADLNTSVKNPRSITLKFTFTPHPDRSGASVGVLIKTALGDLDASAATGSVYLAKREGKFALFSRDMRQELLFEPDGKSAAAGEAVPGA